MPQRESQRIEQLQLESDRENVRAEELKKEAEDKQVILNACLRNAELIYYDNWINECKSQGLLSDSCIELTDMTFDEYMNKNKYLMIKDLSQ